MGKGVEVQILVRRGEMGEVLCPSRLGMSPDTQLHDQRWIQRGPEGHKAFPPSRAPRQEERGTACALPGSDSQLCPC